MRVGVGECGCVRADVGECMRPSVDEGAGEKGERSIMDQKETTTFSATVCASGFGKQHKQQQHVHSPVAPMVRSSDNEFGCVLHRDAATSLFVHA